MTEWNASSSDPFYLSWKLLSSKKLAIFTESNFSASESKGNIFLIGLYQPHKAEVCQRKKKPNNPKKPAKRTNLRRHSVEKQTEMLAGCGCPMCTHRRVQDNPTAPVVSFICSNHYAGDTAASFTAWEKSHYLEITFSTLYLCPLRPLWAFTANSSRSTV